jgi:LysM repeat protein
VAALAAGYFLLPFGDDVPLQTAPVPNGAANGVRLTGIEHDAVAKADPPPVPPKDHEAPQPAPSAPTPARPTPERSAEALRLFELARQSAPDGDRIAARTQLNQALLIGLPPDKESQACSQLAHMADDMIFGLKRDHRDPLVASHVIQPGDTLGKIAEKYHVTDNLLAAINGIKDKNRIRAGQNLKVVHGPFHARIFKNRHVLYVFLQDTFVRQYTVGLGLENGTPTGEWSVTDKLVNPPYYSPRGEGIIAADDPDNPLGERWIGLRGVSGEAAGQQRYGIHGTHDPLTIGMNESLGCVRMYNEDVEALYDMLVSQHSRVIIVE